MGRVGETADVVLWDDFVIAAVHTTDDIGWEVNRNADDANDKGTATIQDPGDTNGVLKVVSSVLHSSNAAALDNVTITPPYKAAYDHNGSLYAETRVKVNAITETVCFGFQANSNGTSGNGTRDTDPLTTEPTDLIWFVIDGADIKCRLSRYDLATSTADAAAAGTLIGTLTDTGLNVTAGTYVTLAISVSLTPGGALGAHFYVDGVLKQVLTDALPNVGVMLTPCMVAGQKTTTAAVTAEFDYVLVASKRV
jgi:hypothetical protein